MTTCAAPSARTVTNDRQRVTGLLVLHMQRHPFVYPPQISSWKVFFIRSCLPARTDLTLVVHANFERCLLYFYLSMAIYASWFFGDGASSSSSTSSRIRRLFLMGLGSMREGQNCLRSNKNFTEKLQLECRTTILKHKKDN